MASYLSAVTDVKLSKTLTMYRLSEHSLAVETGRRRQTWLSREDRLCSHCMLGLTETELHFLTECPKYLNIKDHYYPKWIQYFPNLAFVAQPKNSASFLEKKPNVQLLLQDSYHRVISWGTARERNTQTHTHTHHTLTANKHTHIRPTQTANKHTHTHTHTHCPNTHNTH